VKILHTSDWHLGHRLIEQSQLEEQSLFLNWLTGLMDEQKTDLLLVSGDVFDTGAPSAQSLKLYYDFLVGLKSMHCRHVVITGGNHDAPGTINAPRELLKALSVHVTGKVTGNVEDEILQFNINGEELIVAAVPFLRDQDIRKAVAGESFGQIGDRYKQALINHYAEVAAAVEAVKGGKIPAIAMGHLFVVGGKTSESEQTIYVGNLGDIGAKDFPGIFDYIALGHLHRPQKVAGNDRIRYSGSPLVYSFSEVGYDKKVILLETSDGVIEKAEEIDVPRFREIVRIAGGPDEIGDQLKSIHPNQYRLTPWVEVILGDWPDAGTGSADIHQMADGLNLEILKITLKKERDNVGPEQYAGDTKEISELSPLEVFEMKCREQEFDIENNPQIRDAFNEALQLALQQNKEQ